MKIIIARNGKVLKPNGVEKLKLHFVYEEIDVLSTITSMSVVKESLESIN